LGSSLPPAELAIAGFKRFRGNKMPIFYYARGEKRWRKSGVFIPKKLQLDARPDAVQGGPARPISSSRGQRRNVPRVCDRTLVWPDQRVRSVHLGTEERHTTSASEGPRDRNVRLASLVRLGGVMRSRRGGASSHVRPNTSDHVGSSLDSNQTLGAARSVIW
jgi:hypothetical protein